LCHCGDFCGDYLHFAPLWLLLCHGRLPLKSGDLLLCIESL
jgi:hypothetical protein